MGTAVTTHHENKPVYLRCEFKNQAKQNKTKMFWAKAQLKVFEMIYLLGEGGFSAFFFFPSWRLLIKVTGLEDE